MPGIGTGRVAAWSVLRLRRRAPVNMAVLICAVLAGVMSGPVLAAHSPVGAHPAAVAHRSDGWVRTAGYHACGTDYGVPGPWRGKNIYNTTGKNQTAKQGSGGSGFCDGDVWHFEITIQNDGTASDRFRVRATGTGHWRFVHGTTNITSAVVAGTYRTPSLAPGATFLIKVTTAMGGNDHRLVTASSVADPTKKDAVKVKDTWVFG